MAYSKQTRKELEDKALKLRSAQDAAAAPDATEKDKADLKLIEQDLQAARQKSQRDSKSGSEEKADSSQSHAKKIDRKLDAALKDTFPGSDPVSFVEAGPAKKKDDRDSSAKGNG